MKICSWLIITAENFRDFLVIATEDDEVSKVDQQKPNDILVVADMKFNLIVIF